MSRILMALRMVFKAFIQRDEYARFWMAERLTLSIYPTYKFTDWGRIFLRDEAFIQYYKRFEGDYRYRSYDRKYMLNELLKLAVLVEGDTAECGVFEGASSYLICRRIAGTGKQHHAFDSFEGLSTPEAVDGTHWTSGDLAVAEQKARQNLQEFDFVQYYKGWIPERFPDVADRKFCLLHIDVDLYQPTLDTLAFFYERMTPGGIILCDDYGFLTCPGAQAAMDEFFSARPEPLLSLPTGQGMVVKQ